MTEAAATVAVIWEPRIGVINHLRWISGDDDVRNVSKEGLLAAAGWEALSPRRAIPCWSNLVVYVARHKYCVHCVQHCVAFERISFTPLMMDTFVMYILGD